MSHPEIVVAPGMSAADIAQQSKVPLTVPASSRSFAVMQPHTPHRVTIDCGSHKLALPPGLFALVEVRRGVTEGIRATPQLAYLDAQAATALAADIATQLSEAGFEQEESLDDKARQRSLDRRDSARIGTWRAPLGQNGWRAELWLRRAADGEARTFLQLAEDGYLVTLHVWDIALKENAKI